MNDFGEFEEVAEEGVQNAPQPGAENLPTRVRMPRDKEKLGVILQRFGGNRMEVLCHDLKKRNCRVPGRFKRDFWLRPKDIVLITPWIDDDEKGDIIFKYNSGQIIQLRKKRLLEFTSEAF